MMKYVLQRHTYFPSSAFVLVILLSSYLKFLIAAREVFLVIFDRNAHINAHKYIESTTPHFIFERNPQEVIFPNTVGGRVRTSDVCKIRQGSAGVSFVQTSEVHSHVLLFSIVKKEEKN